MVSVPLQKRSLHEGVRAGHGQKAANVVYPIVHDTRSRGILATCFGLSERTAAMVVELSRASEAVLVGRCWA